MIPPPRGPHICCHSWVAKMIPPPRGPHICCSSIMKTNTAKPRCCKRAAMCTSRNMNSGSFFLMKGSAVSHTQNCRPLPRILAEELSQVWSLTPGRAPRLTLRRRLHQRCRKREGAHGRGHPGPPSLPCIDCWPMHVCGHLSRLGECELSGELHRLLAPPATCLDGHNHEPAPAGCDHLRVCPLLVTSCFQPNGSVHGSRVWMGFALTTGNGGRDPTGQPRAVVQKGPRSNAAGEQNVATGFRADQCGQSDTLSTRSGCWLNALGVGTRVKECPGQYVGNSGRFSTFPSCGRQRQATGLAECCSGWHNQLRICPSPWVDAT